MENNVLKSYDPSNGQLLGQVKKTSLEEINEKVKEAKEAQKKWAGLTIEERIDYLKKGAEVLGSRIEETAILLSKEMGKSFGRAVSEVSGCSNDVGYRTQEIKNAIKTKTIEGYGQTTKLQYRPLGVCGIIAPWNYPVSMGHWLITPALTAGNTVLYKPSEETTLVAKAYVEAFNEVLPKGVLQIIYGDGVQGEALVKSDINFIGFTGSKETGKKIMETAASGFKRLIMEMGGKDPMLVLDDADLERAAGFAVASSYENSGQMCISTERVLVDEKVADKFEKLVTKRAGNYKTGPWNDPEANIGPIINEKQRNRILMHIDDALDKGARLLHGGKNHPDRYIEPTVLADVSEDMKIWKEETFGPVVCISRYKTIDEAIKMANNSDLGLGATVFGKEKAEIVADQLEAGMIGINQGPGGSPGDMPWVGAKESGMGYHGSPDGHRQFTQARVISSR